MAKKVTDKKITVCSILDKLSPPVLKSSLKINKATAVVLVSAGTALAACAGEAKPKLRLLQLLEMLVIRSGVRLARKAKATCISSIKSARLPVSNYREKSA